MAVSESALKTVEDPEQDVLAFDHSILANEYGFYCVPNEYKHRNIVQLIKSGEVYEPATLNFMRRHIGDGDIITGGAFIGDFFPALHEAMAPDALMHSFEPNPMSFEAAQETIRLNHLEQIQFQPVAVGEKADKLVLQIARASGKKIAAGERIVANMSLDDERGIEVDVVTLDSIVPEGRPVSILHLDVEGFEMPALRGATRILTESAPLVILEVGKPWKLKACLKLLDDLAPDAAYQHMGTIENNAIFRAV